MVIYSQQLITDHQAYRISQPVVQCIDIQLKFMVNAYIFINRSCNYSDYSLIVMLMWNGIFLLAS
jgi:hypothetical protein